jgi:diacylglycerol kinase family enzyme
VAVLPLGTENLVARYLKLPRSGRDLADVIAAGRKRRLDACLLNGRRFLIMAGFGFDAEVVRRTHSQRRGHITRFSYAKPLWSALREYRHPKMRFWIDGGEVPVTAGFAVLVNLPAYALGLRVADSAVPDDGLLDLRLFQRCSAFQMLRYFYKVKRGTHESLPDVLSYRVRRLRVESDDPAPVQVDGDPAGWTPSEIEILPAHWEIMIPEGTGTIDPHERIVNDVQS